MTTPRASLLAYFQWRYREQQHPEHIQKKHYDKGELIFLQGCKTEKVVLLISGIAKCYCTESNHKSYILDFVGPDDILGELEVLRQAACLCSVKVLAPTEAYCISKSYFEKLLAEDISLNHLLLDSFSTRIVKTSSRASYQQLYTLDYNLRKLQALQEKQQVNLSKEDMADYLGVSVRSLNRALLRLK